MSWSGIRNSLLAVRRCPVERFLTVCEAFVIDPFTILLDPNPEPKRKRGATAFSSSEASVGSAARPVSDYSSEIAELHSQIADLSAAVADLTDKYHALLRAHEDLARSVQVNIHNFTDNHISIATDATPAHFGKHK